MIRGFRTLQSATAYGENSGIARHGCMDDRMKRAGEADAMILKTTACTNRDRNTEYTNMLKNGQECGDWFTRRLPALLPSGSMVSSCEA